jgi:hypothetical protein
VSRQGQWISGKVAGINQLEMDPAQVVADLESQREKNPEKRNFWVDFISRAAMVIGVLACTLALNFSGMQGNGATTQTASLKDERLWSSIHKIYQEI